MFIKICANTNLEDARLAVELGVDAVGFVFAPSKRRVTAEQVAEITRELPKTVMKVGVFTSTDAEEIVEAAARAGLTDVQLHSTYDENLVLAVERGSGGMVGVLQVVEVAAEVDPETLRGVLRAPLRDPYVAAVLLDASHGGASGGTGRPFAWEHVAGVVREVQAETDGSVIIAGGLRAENVAAAIATFAPFGVDVASGVEQAPGKKDPERLRAFVKAARTGAVGGR